MKLFWKLDDLIALITEWVLASGVLFMAGLLICNVVSRKLFMKSMASADELGGSLLILVTFSGIGYAARKGRHIRMTAIFDTLSPKIKKALMIFISFVTMATYIYVCSIALDYIEYTKMLGKVTSALEMPDWIRAAVVPVGFGLGAIQYLMNIIINIKEPELYVGTEKPEGEDTEC
ncbi:TRAP transporter small permease [Desulfoluna butyratoxydans]|uniref:Tripartite atp-independent periplasmic transporter dctq component n=1 Tax=Desulfoluna butyratoxydans TaxID=231438 RepID=A0A4V6ILC7_9BACT|nr:TRAP transporter small permease [Desulfoluna butyratoxydans]VFQ44558.1 tripartite atp-independent periplasmic transporter dctq component [Desulfoluna butyratoxydans]